MKVRGASSGNWNVRGDVSELLSIAASIDDKLSNNQQLDASENRWLRTLLKRWTDGEDLREDLYQLQKDRSRPRKTERDELIRSVYHSRITRVSADSKAKTALIALIAKREKLHRSVVRKIVSGKSARI